MILSVRALQKIFRTKKSWFSNFEYFTAINDVSFEIHKGEIVGILGPNGAGKTTLMHMLLGILNPTEGSIFYFGKDASKFREEIAPHIAFASAYTELPKHATVYENLVIFGRLYGLYGHILEKRIKEYLALFKLERFAHKETGTLSAGQKTRVMLAKTFMVHPKIILLDEPTASLDPDIALEVRKLILDQKKKYGLTVIVASHDMDEVTEICSRVIVLKEGKIIDDNKPVVLAQQISKTHINLTITAGFSEILDHLTKNNIMYKINENNLEIYVEELHVADFLAKLAALKVIYSHISIKKPTLEEYFLEIARLSKESDV